MSTLETSGQRETAAGPSRPRRLRRIVALALFVVVAVVGSIAIWRDTTLSGLPEIPDPFDVQKYARIDIPPDENAFTFYRRAYELSRVRRGPNTLSGTYTDWSIVDAAQLKYLEDSREVLETWLKGTKCDRALYIQPGDATISTLLPVTQELRQFARLANLQSFKLQHEGDVAGAWPWLKAGLRSGRHSGMNGFLIETLVGNAIYSMTATQARNWSDDPKVDAAMLRAALDDVLTIEKLDRTPSQMVRQEFFGALSGLRDANLSEYELYSQGPGQKTWRGRMGQRMEYVMGQLRHEPERSRRVWRLIIANWLTACDLPREERQKRVRHFGTLTLYEPAPGETPLMATEEVARWYESTRYAKLLMPNWKSVETNGLTRDESTRAALIVHLATQLYKREKGKEPATVDELVGPYLKSIPPGYEPPKAEPESKGTAQ